MVNDSKIKVNVFLHSNLDNFINSKLILIVNVLTALILAYWTKVY